MKRAVFGGTFDPPHLGHIEMANAAVEQLKLDEVILVPAAQNPLKTRIASPGRQRLAMVRLAIAGHPKFSASDIELTRGGTSFMVDTMEELQMVFPGDYYLLLGSDSLKTIEGWKMWERLARICRFAVYSRGSDQFDSLMWQVPEAVADQCVELKLAPQSVSSTKIRDEIFRGYDVEAWTGSAVAQYIEEHKLYREHD